MKMTWEKETDEFHAEGVLIIRNLIPTAIIEECLHTLIQFDKYDNPVKDGNAVFDEDVSGKKYLKYFQHINFYIPAFWKIINSRLSNVVSSLLKQDVYYYGLGLHDKAPGKGTLTPFHQDNYYWCLSPADALTAYVALEEQSPENGGINYFPRTHLLGTLQHSKSKTKAFSSYIENFEPSQWQLLSPTLKPGDVAFHHSNMIHGAEANTSNRHRRALAMIFYGEKSKVSEDMLNAYSNNLVFNRDGKISANIKVDTKATIG